MPILHSTIPTAAPLPSTAPSSASSRGGGAHGVPAGITRHPPSPGGPLYALLTHNRLRPRRVVPHNPQGQRGAPLHQHCLGGHGAGKEQHGAHGLTAQHTTQPPFHAAPNRTDQVGLHTSDTFTFCHHLHSHHCAQRILTVTAQTQLLTFNYKSSASATIKAARKPYYSHVGFTAFLRGRTHTIHPAVPSDTCSSVTAPSACPPSPPPHSSLSIPALHPIQSTVLRG